MSGFYLMHRDWQDSAVFGNEEYSSRDAWVWLIENAAWKPTRARVKGETLDLERGELCFAQRFMAEKWGWSKSRVDRFLKRLCAENMISIRSKSGATAGHGSGQGQSIITICNYADYQDVSDVDRGNAKSQSGATAGQQRGEEEQGNKGTRKEELEAKASPPSGDGFDGDDDHDDQFDLVPDNDTEPSLKPEHLVEAWNDLAAKLGKPKIRALTPERRQRVRARIAGYSLDDFRQVLGNVEASAFLSGDKGRFCNFDWITKKANFQKILEGNYNG